MHMLLESGWKNLSYSFQICPRLKAIEIQIPYDKHHRLSLWAKSHLTHTILSNMK